MKNLLWQTGLVCLVQILSHAAAFGTLHDDIRAPRTAHKRNRTSDSSSLSAAVSADDLSPRALTHWSVDSNFRANLKNRKRQFIVVRNAQLEYQDGTPFRFASFNAPELLEGGIDHFEVEDTFRTLDGLARCVTRTYTLAVKGTPLLWFGPHILGWDKRRNDWIYNETMFQRMDRVVASAGHYDCRLIIPIINQAYGTPDNNWVGNWVNLIIHRKNPSWNYTTAFNTVDFFKDAEMIEAYKKIIKFLLNRVNTVTGIRYGDDPTVLAWSTGNELMYNFGGAQGPAPGAWTVEIAKYIKTLAPRTLVLDGSLARLDDTKACFAPEALAEKNVELFTYHYYGSGDFLRLERDTEYVRSFKKAYVVTEYGFSNTADEVKSLLQQAEVKGTSGTLIWSLRPHSVLGGFKVHREMDNVAAYHAPGWPNPLIPANSWTRTPDWDDKEFAIVKHIRLSSFAMNGHPRPPLHPLPIAPKVWLNAQNRTITWQGAAWALSYEIWLAPHTASAPPRVRRPQWQRIAKDVLDALPAGELAFPLPANARGQLRIRGMSVEGKEGAWSNIINV